MMSLLRRRVVTGLGLVAWLGSCDTPRSTLETTPEASRATTTPPRFQKELQAEGTRFRVQATGPDGLDLRVQVLRNNQEVTQLQARLQGQLADAVATNLNDNRYPELLLFVTEAGTGAYGHLMGYEFLSQGRRPVSLPALDGAAAVGYQGQDQFRVEGQEVLRTYPIYLPTDANCCPSGGRRTVRYQLPEAGLSLQQTGYADAPK